MKPVVITGISGYVGGQIALTLLDAGIEVVGIDRRPLQSHQTNWGVQFVQADFDSDLARNTILSKSPNAIVHCAATSLVTPSIKLPCDYYHNNAAKTLHLLDFVIQTMPQTRVVFSSSAAVYGIPFINPCQEVDPCDPISPYGQSKLMVEMMLKSYHRAYNLNYVAFRYFNACGADSRRRHGQENHATHIMARVLESLRDGTEFVMHGTDYDTQDGTCVRDYVHVEDIAQAHLLAITTAVPCDVYNLGSDHGTSNAEIVQMAQLVTGKKIHQIIGDRRPGDPDILTANADKFTNAVGAWRRYNAHDMLGHAWAWYNNEF